MLVAIDLLLGQRSQRLLIGRNRERLEHYGNAGFVAVQIVYSTRESGKLMLLDKSTGEKVWTQEEQPQSTPLNRVQDTLPPTLARLDVAIPPKTHLIGLGLA